MSKVLENDYYTYQVSWSDGEYVGLCAEFPSLSWLAETQEEAFLGIRDVVAEVVSDMQANDEPIPEPDNINRKKLEAYPDLLEALQGWGELYAMRPLDSGDDMQEILKRCWHKTEAALSKATGDTIGELEGEDE